jgi:GWxTD domain-containing protein
MIKMVVTLHESGIVRVWATSRGANLRVFLVWLVLLLCPSLLPLGSISDTLADEYIVSEDLERLANAHPDSAALHAKLSVANFVKGTVRGRAAAIKQMKQAIRLDSGNMAYRLVLAEMYFRRAQWNNGVSELRRLLRIDPKHELACCRLGKAYLERAMEEWSPDWFRRAAGQLQVVGRDSPVYLDACKHLALCYYDLDKPDSALVLLQSLPEDSLDSECLLILGMSLYDVEDITEAYGVFSAAMGHMDEGWRWRYASAEGVASSEELMSMAAASPSDLPRLIADMWKRRDPNPGTRVNERLVEHVSRVAFADLHFSVPHLDKRGSETARGEVYIRCGRPLSWHFDPFGTDELIDGVADMPRRPGPRDDPGGIHPSVVDELDMLVAQIRSGHKNIPMSHSRRTWSWQYEGFVIDFEDCFMNGDFTFPYEGGYGSFAPGYYMEDVPEVYEMQIRKRMNVVLEALTLLNQVGRPYVKVIYACDTRGLEYTREPGWPQGDFEVEVALLDSAYEDLSRDAMEVELKADTAALCQTNYPLIGSWEVIAPPGEALAAVSVKSKANQAIGFTQKTIDIPLVVDSLWVSDIEVRFGEEGAPNPTHLYRKRSEAYLAFGVCNITPDLEGLGEVDVSYMLTRQEKSSGLLERLADLISGGSEADLSGELTSLWSMYRTRTLGRTTNEVIGIDLSSLSTGDYVVAVRVADKLSGQVAATETWLRIESDI